MADRLKLFILAGEPSGDRIGADLVHRLRARVAVDPSGVGGPALIAEGLKSLYPIDDLAVMGFADVLKRLPLLLWRARQTVNAILRARPDVVILIDAQVFSAEIAKRLKSRGFGGPILLYVAPAVYAWKPERAPKLKALFDEVLAVLPFEPTVMARLGGPPTSYVGHPAVAKLPFRTQEIETGPLLLVPGSRTGELRRTLPMMAGVARRLAGNPKITGFVLPTPSSQRAYVEAEVGSWGLPVTIVSTEAEKAAAFSQALGAVAVAGTVTLELALAGVPMVATYIGDSGQAKRFQKYGVKFVALPNIVLGRATVPEALFTVADPERLAEMVRALADDPEARRLQAAAFHELRQLMEKGAPEAPLVDPAERVLAHLKPAYRSIIDT
jgi:lipid-A-disaccharide synthase